MSERAFCSRRVTTTSDCQRAMREQQGTGELMLLPKIPSFSESGHKRHESGPTF